MDKGRLVIQSSLCIIMKLFEQETNEEKKSQVIQVFAVGAIL